MVDVRMRGFAQRTRVADAWQWIRQQVQPGDREWVDLAAAAGRMLAEDVHSACDVPGFRRSMMDGFAILAADSHGASPYNPLRLEVIDQAMPGCTCERPVVSGTAVRIMTGAPVPPGADAVIPVEKVQIEGGDILVLDAIAQGKHVARPGEDVDRGDCVLQAPRWLRAQDLGILASIGVGTVPVVRRPRVRILVTGNELLPPGAVPSGPQIVDSNSPMLRALVQRDGGVVNHPGIVRDHPDAIRQAMLADVDVVLVSGGSSVGQEDYAPAIVRADGELPIHGVAMRPSSPAGMGRLGHRLVFLLPGNPVSCLAAYDFFAGRAIRRLGGRPWNWPYRCRRGLLSRKITSVVGRVDYARVAWQQGQITPLAISGASMLSSTTRADGFVVVPEDSEGYAEGTSVDTWMYDQSLTDISTVGQGPCGPEPTMPE